MDIRCGRLIRRGWVGIAFVALQSLFSSSSFAAAPVEELWSQSKIWQIDIEISPKEFEAMQPTAPAIFGGPVPGNAARTNDALVEQGETERNLFGTEFRWVEGNVSISKHKFEKIGIRYAGDITYLASTTNLKRPLKIELGRYTQQSWGNVRTLQLHAMPLDPSKSREALAFSVFSACGVPAPRTAFADVRLTVTNRFENERLGLYTIVEDVDAAFLQRNFQSNNGLVFKPFGMKGIDYLGEEWDVYKTAYRPQSEASSEQQQRLIAFAKLINTATDEDFISQLDSFVDVDQLLRFMAANALTSNLESFFALGHNYWLYLDSKTNLFHFIPGDLEFSFANLLLMGSPEQLIELSVMKPYPGPNRLIDRMMGIKDLSVRYRKLIEDLIGTVITKEQLISELEAIEQATKEIRDREQQDIEIRRKAIPPLAGPQGFPLGVASNGLPRAPQPPDLKSFIEKRLAAVSKQLNEKSGGYVPLPPNFGPPPPSVPGAGGPPRGNGNEAPINEATFRQSVEVPNDFKATLFAAPPQVSYPVAIACEPNGIVYVAIDEQGSLGRTPGGGRIVRCVDKDDDGKVDATTLYAKVEHPRGVVYRDGKLWVMHPPNLSVFQDEDGDGVADKQEVLVTGLTTDQIDNRGGDHTTNCVRMGIDGWLYIGVGDYGIKLAEGKDGKKLVLRGGGVVRVRPDGTELELYCSGLRNPFDLAIDPLMNIFTRDNTNDGAGWDTRVSLLKQSALYGYTQLFANFTDEIMPTLGTFGNSGGTGALYIQDSRWPPPYQDSLFTGDWGRSEVYRHSLAPNGASFDLKQEVFMKLPRATGMDIDGRGRLYVASWRGGEASVYAGPNIGFIARVAPKNLAAEPFPDMTKATKNELVQYLSSYYSITRMHAQAEILSRGQDTSTTSLIFTLASDRNALLDGRVAAIYTLKQLDGRASMENLIKLSYMPDVREFAIRALTDRLSELEGLDLEPFYDAVSDPSPRIQAQAAISLGRLNNLAAASSLLGLASREPGSSMPTVKPLQNQPDPGRVVPHLAVRALVKIGAVDACLEALDSDHSEGAFWALRYMHDAKAVTGLIQRLNTARTVELRRNIILTLIRLYNREADYDGSWWGIRPDSTGPYYDRTQWEMSSRIGSVIKTALADSDLETARFIKDGLKRYGVSIPGIQIDIDKTSREIDKPISLPQVDPSDRNQIGNMSYDAVLDRALKSTGDVKNGEALFRQQSCNACHTIADGQTPKGPHLFEIGKKYKPAELLESILKPSEKIAQGYETHQFLTVDGKTIQGFVVSERAGVTIVRQSDSSSVELQKSDIEERKIHKISGMPEGLVTNLTPENLADLIAYLQSLK